MRSGVLVLLISVNAFAQRPAFEVASVRPSVDPARIANEPFFCSFGCFNEGRLKVVGSRVDLANMPLDQIVVRAYRIRSDQLAGPDWLRQERFDILANIPEGATAAQVPEMLQTLLIERFRLEIHREAREQPVYVLAVNKNGPNLKRSTAAPPSEAPSDTTLNSPKGWGPMRMNRTASDQNAPEMELLAITMPMLADALSQFMDRPVIDRTGLKSSYEIGLWAQDIGPFLADRFAKVKGAAPGNGQAPGTGPAVASDPTGSSTVFKTLERQGLKLERAKLPVEMLVIDRVDRAPTEN